MTPAVYLEDFKRLKGRYWHEISPPSDRLSRFCKYAKATYEAVKLWKYRRKRVFTPQNWHAQRPEHAAQFLEHGASYWHRAFTPLTGE